MYLSLFTYHHIAMLCFSYHVMSYTFIIFESFAYTYHFFYVSCLIICHILFMSSCTLLLILVTVYYHRITILCFSYHVMSFTLSFLNHLHILIICFMFHACITLEVDKGNYKGPKALYSLCETVVYKGPKALLLLYETMTIYKGPKAL